MRKDKFSNGSFIHVYNRGNKKADIFKDDDDKWRFLKILCYFNDEYAPIQIFRELEFFKRHKNLKSFNRPQNWPIRNPLVEILSYRLMQNHYHLLLRVLNVAGVTEFMRKLGTGYTNYFNSKYGETGKVFQGSYKARAIEDENYLQYIDGYIHIINSLDAYELSSVDALKRIDEVFDSILDDPFCGLGERFGVRNLSIINGAYLNNKFKDLKIYKKFAQDVVLSSNFKGMLNKLAIDTV
jgi:REP element-mobilizing transposase RayT